MLPVYDVRPPAVLEGQNNGRLTLGILRQTPGLDAGPTLTLVETATRSWRAMSSAAETAGIVLKATSTVDSYRPYAVQQAIFKARYSPTRIPGQPTKTCNGITYWQKPDTAMAACPGTSNHGWGLAVDVQDAAGKRLDWLEANTKAYGWSWEAQSEPWHIRYTAGDHIPQAVLDYEEGATMAITEADAELIASTLLKTLLGSTGPTVGVALQDGYRNTVKILEQMAGGVQVPAVVDVSDASVAKIADAVNDDAAQRLTD